LSAGFAANGPIGWQLTLRVFVNFNLKRHAMTMSAAERATIPPPPRMCLVLARAGRAVLDGGWWPRSTDPFVELPGLVLALGDRFGMIYSLMLNRSAWDGQPRRLGVGGRVIRLGWFANLDLALAIATTERGSQLDLLVVPVHTPEEAARNAMVLAADPANTMRAPAIVAAIPVVPASDSATATRLDAGAGAVWDNEGGHLEDRPVRSPDRSPTAVSS
jgi:hypothetical protein